MLPAAASEVAAEPHCSPEAERSPPATASEAATPSFALTDGEARDGAPPAARQPSDAPQDSSGSFQDEDLEDDETGWKLIHGDVFRLPPRMSLLCSLCGAGTQIGALFLGTFLFGTVGMFHPYGRGTVQVTVLVLYALTAGMSGFVSTTMFKKFKAEKQGSNWVRNVVQTILLFAVPFAATWFVANMVAVANDMAVPVAEP